MRTRFTYRGYDVEIDAFDREPDDVGPKVVVGMKIVKASDGVVLFEEAPIRMMPLGVKITTKLAVAYRSDESIRRIDDALK